MNENNKRDFGRDTKGDERMNDKKLLRPLKIEEVKLGLRIFFEYWHNFNSRSRALRYKPATWLNFIDGKAIIYVHGNKSSSQVDIKTLYVQGRK